jgi:predicted outer membrane repeat protein
MFRSNGTFAQLPLVLAGALVSAGRASAQTIWHVDDSAPPAGDGARWSSAFVSLQDALDVAVNGDEIWVAEGVYRPSVATDAADPRSVTFRVHGQVRVYGGFAGTETSLAQRAGSFRRTELSGDVGIAGDPADNAYHVVTVNGHPRIDGFTIHGARALAAAIPGGNHGGGIYCETATGVNVWLANCTFVDNEANQGAGLYVQLGTVTTEWCTFTGNSANLGGAIYAMTSSAYVSHTRFLSNHATTNGGAIFLSSIHWDAQSGPAITLVDSSFHGNTAQRGGAVYMGGNQFNAGNAAFFQCTLAYNQATLAGGAIYATTTSTIPARSYLFGSIAWANDAPAGPQLFGRHTIAWSDVQGGPLTGVAGNIDADPLFVDGVAGDLRLRLGSPASDAASVDFLPLDLLDLDADQLTLAEPIPFDLARSARVVDDPLAADTGCCGAPMVDMGAYEAH